MKYLCQYKNNKGLQVTEEVVADSEIAVKRKIILTHPLAEIVDVKLFEKVGVATTDKPIKKPWNKSLLLGSIFGVVFLVLIVIILVIVFNGRDDKIEANSGKSEDGSKEFTYANAYKNIVSISSKGSVSTGFKLKIDDTVYLYTCYHCIKSANKVTCRDSNDEILELGNLEFCYDRDLVRFELPNEKSGFDLAPKDSLKIGAAVFAYGDTSGMGVMTQNKGHVLAIGNHKVEIDAAVLQGNSGGPVLNEDGRVIAVISSCSHDDSIWSKDTRYENVRKFAERADGGEWFEVSYDDYCEDFAFLYDTFVMTEELREYNKITSGRKFIDRVARPFAYDQRYKGDTGYAQLIQGIYATWNMASDATEEMDMLSKKSNGRIESRADNNAYYEVLKKRNRYVRLACCTLHLKVLNFARDELRAMDANYLKKERDLLLKDIETVLIPAIKTGEEDYDRMDKRAYEIYKLNYDKARN